MSQRYPALGAQNFGSNFDKYYRKQTWKNWIKWVVWYAVCCLNNRITAQETGAFGSIRAEGNAVAEVTVDATPRLVVTAWSVNGISSAPVTPDEASGWIEIPAGGGGMGNYDVAARVSFSGSDDSTYLFEIYKWNGTAFVATGIRAEYTFAAAAGSGADVAVAALGGHVFLQEGEQIALFQSTANGAAMTITEAQLAITRV